MSEGVEYLDADDQVDLAVGPLGDPPPIRDLGLLGAAAARPQASAFGENAYPSLHHKAAALLHSLARTQPLVDGNERLARPATIAFYGLDGHRLTLSNDET